MGPGPSQAEFQQLQQQRNQLKQQQGMITWSHSQLQAASEQAAQAAAQAAKHEETASCAKHCLAHFGRKSSLFQTHQIQASPPGDLARQPEVSLTTGEQKIIFQAAACQWKG